MTNLIAGVRSKESLLKSTFINIISACLTAIKNKYNEFKTVGQGMMANLIAGVREKDDSVKEIFVNIVSSSLTEIRNRYSDFKDAGEYLVKGFANGINEYTWYAEARAAAMARAAAAAAEAELDINSPSKVGERIGGFFGMGFVNSLIEYADKSYEAGAEMATAAKNGLNAVVSKVRDFINGELDTQPTIRPLLDLSEVRLATSQLTALLSKDQAMKISTEMGRGTAKVIQNEESGDTTASVGGNTYSFTQNNYSPKALSRVEIYRQTKNQFSAMERMAKA